MINKVGNVNVTNNINKIAFKTKETVITPQENVQKEYSLKANDALENYNRAGLKLSNILNVKPMLPTVITPDAIDSLPGEKIYTSDGKLHTIVDKKDDRVTIYTLDKENPNMISHISVEDANTNKPLWSQHNVIENGKYSRMLLTSYDKKGEENAFTGYHDGKLSYAGRIVKSADGTITTVEKLFDTNSYSITSEKEGVGYSSMHLSGDMKSMRIHETLENTFGERTRYVNLYNGRPISVEEFQKVSIPNDFAKELLEDKELTPAHEVDVAKIKSALENSDGVETRYSNGATETKTVTKNGETTVLRYTPEQKLESIETSDKKIEVIADNAYNYIENLPGGITKETFRSDFMTRITFNNNGMVKEVGYDAKTNKPMYYHEFEKTSNGNPDYKKTYAFDKNGNLTDAM